MRALCGGVHGGVRGRSSRVLRAHVYAQETLVPMRTAITPAPIAQASCLHAHWRARARQGVISADFPWHGWPKSREVMSVPMHGCGLDI